MQRGANLGPSRADRDHIDLLMTSEPLDQRGKSNEEPGPRLYLSSEVVPHFLGAVGHEGPRSTPSVRSSRTNVARTNIRSRSSPMAWLARRT